MLLTVFLPIAIRAIKPIYVKMVITRLCYFFNKISQKVINEDELNDLQDFIGETMSQLEICFPPGFFYITKHLMIQMVDQIRALGLLYLHKMWMYERFMSILGGSHLLIFGQEHLEAWPYPIFGFGRISRFTGRTGQTGLGAEQTGRDTG